MKNKLSLLIIASVLLFISGCATLNSMHGTYVSITPLASRGFDSDKFETLGFAYAPDSENGKLFKKELMTVFRSDHFKIPSEKDELEAIQKSGKNYSGAVQVNDAQHLGRLLGVKAIIIINKAEFSSDGKALYIELEFVDPYGGVLVRTVHKGGDNPESLNSAAWSILNGIKLEDLKYERKGDKDRKHLLFP